jgi:hypothetical protein
MTPNDAPEHHTTPPAADDAHTVPRHTTPAWESELLLSIGLVVGLLQIPAVLDTRFDAAVARVSELWLMPITYAYFYAKVAIYGLVVSFVVHLLTRGFWVALLGLRSVFPEGVRWNRLTRMGPVAQQLARRESVPLPALIEQVDNFASAVFAFGFMMLATAISIGVVIVAVSVLATLISQYLLGGHNQFKTLLLLLSVTVVPFVLASVIDRRIGKRLHPGGRAWRALSFVLTGWRHVFGSHLYREMMLVFGSNIGQRLAGALAGGVFFVLAVAVVAEVAIRRNEFEPFATGDMPHAGVAVLESAHYADRRGDHWHQSPQPFVQSDVISDPYLRLFVPASPRRLAATASSGCPAVSQAADEDRAREATRRAALLECFGRLIEPRLDGDPIGAPAFEFGDDPQSSLPGLVAHLPIKDLAPGRHELTLKRIRGREDEGKADPDEAIRIAFWR